MMARRAFIVNSAGGRPAASGIGGASPQSGAPSSDAEAKSGYAQVNGLRLYYEICGGAGTPLILMHGGIGSIEMFSSILPALASRRKVIAVDLQGHGRTADTDRPLSYEAMADDIAGLLKHLGIEKADVMGYSLGAGVAVRTAARYPGAVRKLVVVSVPYRRDGWHADILPHMARIGPEMAEQMKPSPLYQTYARVAPRREDWTRLVVKVGALVNTDYDWSKDVSVIQSPTMLVFGDADSVRPEHAVEFFKLLGGGQRDGGWDGSGISKARLAFLPGATHYNICAQPALVATVAPFLDAAPSDAK